MARNGLPTQATEEMPRRRRKPADGHMALAREPENPNLVRRDIQVTTLFSPEARVQILTGDNRRILPSIPSESVQCCVTSPPYWGLRDYAHDDQIGTENTPTAYVRNLVDVFQEVRRTLKNDGTLWLNVGDGYARNGGTGRHGPNAIVGNTRKMIQRRNCKVPPCWGLKDKDLMGLPWHVAFAMQEDGWYLRSRIIWVKRTAMPESVRDRPTNATEDIFLFSKSARYYYNARGVREPTGANLRNVWILGPDPSNNGHPATFPRELVRRCLMLGSKAGDTVLDPFGGSGTTGVAAVELERSAILIELNPRYSLVSEGRLNGQVRGISKETRARILERNGYTCQMCGVAAGDPDPLGGPRTVRLAIGHIVDKSKGGDDSLTNLRAICTACNEGLQNTSPPKPDRIHLLAQVRRATIDDQRAVLQWLERKFASHAEPTPPR